MIFDPENRIVQLCARAMNLEGEGTLMNASRLCLKAWAECINDFERFIAAHYVARHQQTVKKKMKWDQRALKFALLIKDGGMETYYPSLYLNIGKCHEELKEFNAAMRQYKKALLYLDFLPDNGYGKMVSSGVHNDIEKITANMFAR